MKFTLLKAVVFLICVQILSACVSSDNSKFFKNIPSKDYSGMYLRGVFNWWEVNDAFKLVASNDSEYAVTIELIADGQPYDFKVADSAWTMTLNCGNKFGGDAMQLNEPVSLICAADSLNLQFTPSETGKYRFVLKVANNNPVLSIIKVG